MAKQCANEASKRQMSEYYNRKIMEVQVKLRCYKLIAC